MKKVIIFLAVIIVLFGAISFLTNAKNKEKSEDNPYNKETLDAQTIAQLDDPNYQNLILPEELQEKLDNKEDVTVYFYSPACTHCQRTTPELAPLAKEMDIDMLQYNLLEFEQGWDDYQIESTPTLVQYKNGKEVARIVGYNEPEVFRAWFNENTKK
ncbi:thioredoxin family protein [Neobacillus sp. LXY-4]|uniref:thioredoxin family protein n=1 Tax=Neobacillus sp. LXY-4 TaxID=3379826 RepID=UPI003EE34FE8